MAADAPPGLADLPATLADHNPLAISPQFSAQLAARFAQETATAAFQLSVQVDSQQLEIQSLVQRVSELEAWKANAKATIQSLREALHTMRGSFNKLGLSVPEVCEIGNDARNPKSIEISTLQTRSELSVSAGSNQRKVRERDRSADSKEYRKGRDIQKKVVGPDEVIRAEWEIPNLKNKLKTTMAKATVSPEITFAKEGVGELWGSAPCRLMLWPEASETDVPLRRSKVAKDEYLKKVTEGPLHARLEFKVMSSVEANAHFYLTIGPEDNPVRSGPHKHDFQEKAVFSTSEFLDDKQNPVDWLKMLDENGALLVGVEIICEPGDLEWRSVTR